MNSSGIKRGLAVSAISALAVAGMPALAGTANAVPLQNTAGGADAVVLYTQGAGTTDVSAKNDGTNATISLVAGGGSNVTSVLFQYRINGAGDRINIGAPITRNADGAFATEWTPSFPVGTATVQIFAVANTAQEVSTTKVVAANAATKTVELGTEGNLGYWLSPEDSSVSVAVKGTASEAGDVAVNVASQPAIAADTFPAAVPAGAPAGSTATFSGVYDITGYNFGSGAEDNELVLRGAIETFTDDAEASTLYRQTLTTVTAVADRTQVPTGQTAKILVTVKDQFGNPVPNVLVNYNTPDTAADPDTLPQPSGAPGLATDANGQREFTLPAGAYTFFANNNDVDATQEAGDLAATPVTITEYAPVNTSLVASAVKGYNAFDVDELDADDFIATLKDQAGNPVAGQPVQVRWTFDPAAPNVNNTVIDYANAGNTDAQGKVALTYPANAAFQGTGTVTIDVRRPNVGAEGGLLNGQSLTVEVGESEIAYSDGDSATTPVNSSGTYVAKLALVSGTALPGRSVVSTYAPGADSSLSTTQPAGTTRDSATQATSVTAADGSFSVSVTDPAVPANVTPVAENGTLASDATALSGAGDAASADAQDSLAIRFAAAPVPAKITIDQDVISGAVAGPGTPVDFDVLVEDKDGNDLGDVPVEVTVSSGFLTPGADGDEEYDDLTPASAPVNGAEAGVWKNDGASKTYTTGDSGVALGTAGFAATIERDPGFDDDGLVTATVTVKAGSITETRTIVFNSGSMLNVGSVELAPISSPASGDVPVGSSVEYNVNLTDQFGNLVRGQSVAIFDNTTVADVTTDGDGGNAFSDLANDSASVVATSEAEANQIVSARFVKSNSLIWNGSGDAAVVGTGSETVTDSADAINWVEGIDPVVDEVIASLRGQNNGARADVLRVVTGPAADGAQVRLFRVVNGDRTRVAVKTLNDAGIARFRVADRNGRGFTKYVAIVGATNDTTRDVSNRKRVR